MKLMWHHSAVTHLDSQCSHIRLLLCWCVISGRSVRYRFWYYGNFIESLRDAAIFPISDAWFLTSPAVWVPCKTHCIGNCWQMERCDCAFL